VLDYCVKMFFGALRISRRMRRKEARQKRNRDMNTDLYKSAQLPLSR